MDEPEPGLDGTTAPSGSVWVTLACAFTLVCGLCLLTTPTWETNDDVAMAMTAHGYGSAASSSPLLLYSNVLWGVLVQALPSVDGIQGYSLATLGILLAVAWAILWFSVRLGWGYVNSCFLALLLLPRPTVFPQFTINAGMLAVAGVMGWCTYARSGGRLLLWLASVLVFLGFLVRSRECVLVLAVCVPLWPWALLRTQRRAQAAAALLLGAVLVAWAVDVHAYAGPEWQRFNDLEPLLWAFTDFGAGEHLRRAPDIMARHGYSANDVALLVNWFFVDPAITHVESLRAMLAELGPLTAQPGSLALGWSGVTGLLTAATAPLLVCAVVLMAVNHTWRATLTAVLLLGAVFLLGVMGRPGVQRVMLPLTALLVVAPLVARPLPLGWRQSAVAGTLWLAMVWNGVVLRPQAKAAAETVTRVRQQLDAMPQGLWVAWGSAFPYEHAYPVLSRHPERAPFTFYALGTDTLAPYSLAAAEEQAGRGLLTGLLSNEGIRVIATRGQVELLAGYCRQRHLAQLSILEARPLPSFALLRLRCTAGGTTR